MISIFMLTSHFCSLIVFLSSLSCHSVFSLILLSSLKIMILNSFSGNSQISIFFGVNFWKSVRSFGNIFSFSCL